MGLMDNINKDNLADMAKDQLKQHDDQVDAALDRGAEMAGEKLGHSDQINQGMDMGQAKLDEWTGADDVAEGDPTNNA